MEVKRGPGVPGPNEPIAERLEEVAQILQEQGANPFRVRAYRRGAATLRTLERPAAQVLEEGGLAGLEAFPGIGESLARAIREVVRTGRLPMLERLGGESDPVALFRSVPGLGRRTAERLHHDLGLESLEELEAAAHRRRGQAAQLPTIAPRRFNPKHETWLPVLHTRRGGRHYTALFSNTARAHRLEATRDWVVLYLDGGREERQWTVITARRGPLAGKRIVRGREAECASHYGIGFADSGDTPEAPPGNPSAAA